MNALEYKNEAHLIYLLVDGKLLLRQIGNHL